MRQRSDWSDSLRVNNVHPEVSLHDVVKVGRILERWIAPVQSSHPARKKIVRARPIKSIIQSSAQINGRVSSADVSNITLEIGGVRNVKSHLFGRISKIG